MKWIDTQPEFDAWIATVASAPTLAIDTEADSLHSYFDKVCLVQMSIPGHDVLIDPLAGIDLSPIGPILADRSITKIFHGGDYDLRILNRDFGFEVNNLIDTVICAQLLGYEAFGLGALLARHFKIEVNKAHQRADWAKRPLTRELRDYAATDTRHLIELAGILRSELEALGRWEWAIEEFERLETIRFSPGEPDEEGWRKVKGSGRLDRRGMAVLAQLHAWRDGQAQNADRPAFKILGTEALLAISTRRPKTEEELRQIPGMAAWQGRKYAGEILPMVERALALPESELPERKAAKGWQRDRELERMVEKLKVIRDRIAGDLKIDPSLLAPRHVLTAIAMQKPTTPAELQSVPNLRRWQRSLLGEAILLAASPPR
ncbi:MAG: ribonuclease D [Thermoanaerobaculia bacterium]